MSDTNLPPATPPSPGLPPTPVDPISAVQGPAIGLMIVGGVYLLYALLVLGMMVLGMGFSALQGNLSVLSAGLTGIRGIISILFSIAFGGTMLYGGMQMKALKNYNLAMAASIVALFPCSCCCIVGLPVGIWSLVTLLKPEVKAAFNTKPGGFPV